MIKKKTSISQCCILLNYCCLDPLPGFEDKRNNAKQSEDVSEKNRERMPDKEIFKAFCVGRIQKLGFGHDRERADVRAFQLRIMVVMMIVRTPLDTARTERVNPKNPHEKFRQARFG